MAIIPSNFDHGVINREAIGDTAAFIRAGEDVSPLACVHQASISRECFMQIVVLPGGILLLRGTTLVIAVLLAQLGILALILIVTRPVIDHLDTEERLVHAEQFAVPRGSTQGGAGLGRSPSFDSRMPSQILNVDDRIWSVMTRSEDIVLRRLAIVAPVSSETLRDFITVSHVKNDPTVLAHAWPDARVPCRCQCSSASARYSGCGRRCQTGRRPRSRPRHTGRGRSRR